VPHQHLTHKHSRENTTGIGTKSYASLEQIKSKDNDNKTDVYFLEKTHAKSKAKKSKKKKKGEKKAS